MTRHKSACKLAAPVGDKKQTGLDLAAWKRWTFALIPALGLVEASAHCVQTCSVTPARDWAAARDYVASHARPEDLVAFAPRWADPLGREYFGPGLATIEREARADESRFPRAFEVSIRGAHVSTLTEWKRADERLFGGVRVTTWENPSPAVTLEDLVSRVEAQRVQVVRVQGNGEAECAFVRTGVQSGSLGFGPAVPSDHFQCPGGGFVAMSVVADWEYYPRRCVYAPPLGAGALLRLRFPGVRLGRSIVGHHTLYVEAERGRSGAPVTVTFKVGEAVVGQAVHKDGDGWKPFEFDTSALAGASGDVVVEIGAASGDQRKYCFEAITR